MAKLDIDESLVRRLSELLDETGLTEIEYEAEGHRIRVARESRVAFAPAASTLAGQGEPVASAAETSAADAGVPENAVTSPMVGTVYLSPEPGTPSLVKLGDQVEQGYVLTPDTVEVLTHHKFSKGHRARKGWRNGIENV